MGRGLVSTLDTRADVGGEVEALFREAHQRRRHRRVIGGAVLVAVLLLVGIVFVVGGIGGRGADRGAARPGRPPSPVSAPPQTVPAGAGVVGRGPTAIDFSDRSHGWIASGGNLGPQTFNPSIVRTADGGQSWQRTPVPNLAAQSIDPATNYALGGLVGIHFANPERGWFLQGGIGWQTNNAGTSWTKMNLPVDGGLVALVSAGNDVWALIDTCPIHAVSCPQNVAKGGLFHATSAPVLKWQRVGGALPAGVGALYPTARKSVVVAFGNVHYARTLGKVSAGSLTSSCGLIGGLNGGKVAGVCDSGGGGNASASNIAVSDDGGATWKTLIDGPPSTQWVGSSTTDGDDAVLYVTGGQTLWRTSASKPGWRAVLEAQVGSADEIYPVYFTGIHGYALISSGLDAHWFETNDGGLDWEPVRLP